MKRKTLYNLIFALFFTAVYGYCLYRLYTLGYGVAHYALITFAGAIIVGVWTAIMNATEVDDNIEI